jgi:hypothetical protein
MKGIIHSRFFLMHQPPTIPEGDEEYEGVEQRGEGTRFPHTGAQQQPPHPPMHDTLTTASELQSREDEGVGYGPTPTFQNEMIAVSGDVPTEASQQAEYDQPSSVEQPIIEDGAMDGAPPATDAENEIQGQLDEGGALAGISEDESAIHESTVGLDGEKPLPVIVESSMVPTEESLDTTPRVIPTDEQIKPDEMIHEGVS